MNLEDKFKDNKYNIFNRNSMDEFSSFLEADYDGAILALLDHDGIEAIKKQRVEKVINYILDFSKYKNEVFKNKEFLDLFVNSDVSWYLECLDNLKFETYDLILKRVYNDEKNKDKFKKLLSYFSDSYKINLLNHWPYDKELIYSLLSGTNNVRIINTILNNYVLDFTHEDFRVSSFFETIKSINEKEMYKKMMGETKKADYINIPGYLINERLAQKLFDMYDIADLRRVVNTMGYSCNTDVIDKYIEKREAEHISSLTNNYISIYNSFMRYIENDDYEERINCVKMCHKVDENLFEHIYEQYRSGGKEGLYNYIKKLSGQLISDYIIDYLFKENYYNIMIDIRELLNFYFAGNINLPEERLMMYEELSNIDYYSDEEKKEIFNKYKDKKVMEMFYDDMAFARRIVGESLKDYSLSKEELSQYKDEELSKEYGVDVYRIEDNPFFAIVKTGRKLYDNMPTGHSFSLIGNGSIAVFGDPKDSNTFLYDSSSLTPEQVVHVFPYDSFTFFRPFEYEVRASDKNNLLMMPDELTAPTGLQDNGKYRYNELLILEEGKKKTDMDVMVPQLKKMALYCLDAIRNQDVEAAKMNDVGIFLVNSKNFHKAEETSKSIFRHKDNIGLDEYYSHSNKDKLKQNR